MQSTKFEVEQIGHGFNAIAKDVFVAVGQTFFQIHNHLFRAEIAIGLHVSLTEDEERDAPLDGRIESFFPDFPGKPRNGKVFVLEMVEQVVPGQLVGGVLKKLTCRPLPQAVQHLVQYGRPHFIRS